VLFPLLVLTLTAIPGPLAPPATESAPALQVQEPSAPKPAPKQDPKPAPKSGGSASGRSNPGASGAGGAQAPRGKSGGSGAAPRATGEPKLKRRGT